MAGRSGTGPGPAARKEGQVALVHPVREEIDVRSRS